MKNEENEIERYLSEFRPKAVRTLKLPHATARGRAKWMVAAAIVALCTGSAVWYSRHGDRNVSPAPVQASRVEMAVTWARSNSIYLTKLALEDDAQFQARLAAESRTVLPNFQDPQSTLHALAKE